MKNQVSTKIYKRTKNNKNKRIWLQTGNREGYDIMQS